MQHRLDWDQPAKLMRGDQVNQFGDGYRQVLGPTIAEGDVGELLEQLRAMSPRDAAKMYICNEGSNPLTLAEVEQQASEQTNS
jgi:uncharacterized protein YidB (DUF937 family)